MPQTRQTPADFSPAGILSWLQHADSANLPRDHRNLLWLLSAPQLLHTDELPAPAWQPHDRERLCREVLSGQLDQPLREALAAPRSHFLGTYYEQLWAFILSHSECSRLHATNLQIHHDGVTLGEFDFIAEHARHEQRGQAENFHLEVAIKFYLHNANYAPNLWLGPNARDRLDIKVSKLRAQQLTFSTQPQAAAELRRRQITPQSIYNNLQGYLFYPLGERQLDHTASSVRLHPQHLRGWWTRPSCPNLSSALRGILALDAQDSFTDTGWCELDDKRDWLAPFCLTPSKRECTPLSTHELASTAHQLQGQTFKPRLYALVRGEDDAMIECARLFLVPDAWPALAKTAPAL